MLHDLTLFCQLYTEVIKHARTVHIKLQSRKNWYVEREQQKTYTVKRKVFYLSVWKGLRFENPMLVKLLY